MLEVGPRRRAKIVSTGFYVPEKVLTNADLEKTVDTTDEWIVTRTGMKERHIVAEDQATSDLVLPAARRALKNAHLEAKDIDLIIVATGERLHVPKEKVYVNIHKYGNVSSATIPIALDELNSEGRLK
jgi:3-oxoacyl-[acyl-carrier-protein] synthase III